MRAEFGVNEGEGVGGGQGQRAGALGGIQVADLAGHGSGSAVYLVH